MTNLNEVTNEMKKNSGTNVAWSFVMFVSLTSTVFRVCSLFRNFSFSFLNCVSIVLVVFLWVIWTWRTWSTSSVRVSQLLSYVFFESLSPHARPGPVVMCHSDSSGNHFESSEFGLFVCSKIAERFCIISHCFHCFCSCFCVVSLSVYVVSVWSPCLFNRHRWQPRSHVTSPTLSTFSSLYSSVFSILTLHLTFRTFVHWISFCITRISPYLG